MKNSHNPSPQPFVLPVVLPAPETDAPKVAPGDLEVAPGHPDAPSPWLDFWRKILVLAEGLDAKEAEAEPMAIPCGRSACG